MSEGIGDRLIEERERLRLTRAEFREKCGASKTAQLYFETGKQKPGGAYLIAADALGVDILYVLTGRKGAPRVRANTAHASGGAIAVAGNSNTVTGNNTNAPTRRKR